MRIDAAAILQFLGHRLDLDFVAVQESPTSVRIDWLSASQMPTEAEIDAAYPAMVQKQAEAAEDAALREQAKAAYQDLQTIRTGAQSIIDDQTITNAEAVVYVRQLAQAVSKLAQVEQHLIRNLFGR